MRIYSIDTFFKQIISFHDFHERFFCVLGSDIEDRRQILQDLLAALVKKHPDLDRKNVYTNEDSVEKVLIEIQSVDLFATRRCFMIPQIDEWSSKDQDAFLEQINKLDATQFICFSADNLSSKTSELTKLKDKLLILDLSKEKPWDKRKRFIDKLILFAKHNGKVLSSEDASKMLDHFGFDISLLKTEIEKLCLMMQNEKKIVFVISSVSSKQDKIWQTADHILLGNHKSFQIEVDQQEFYLLTSQIRSRIYLALAVLEKNDTYLKKVGMHESLLAKYTQLFEKLEKNFFLNALTELYKIECLARAGGLKAQDLIEILSCKLSIAIKDKK